MRYFKIVLYLIFLILLDSVSSQSVDNDFNKRIEKKWGMEEDDKPAIKPPANNYTLAPVPMLLARFEPQKQEFGIKHEEETTVIGKFGTRFIIPANAIELPDNYRKNDLINFEIIEVYNDLDFITAGIDMMIQEKGRTHIFESRGMFKISASYAYQPLKLKKGYNVKVIIPSLIYSDKKMKMYKLVNNKWADRGDFSSDNDVPLTATEGPPPLLFKALDDFTWWNCDYASPDSVCLEGKLSGGDGGESVTMVGVDHKTAATRYADNYGSFTVNAINGKKIKLIALDKKGNIGFSKEIDTTKIDSASFSKKTKCSSVGEIQMSKVSKEILSNRKKFLAYVGLFDIIE